MAGLILADSDGCVVDGFLAQYEATCLAVASLRTVDDAKLMRDKAEAIRVYARQAKNRQLEIDAADIRVRAERRLGQLLAEEKEAGRLREGRPSKNGSDLEPFPERKSLADLGIEDRKLSSRAQKLAEMGDSEFEASLSAWREDAAEHAGRVALDLTKRARKDERAEQRAAEARQAGSFTNDLYAYIRQGRKFGCIYADPPWLYDNQGTRAATGNHYNGMTVDALCALPVRELAADDAHLHLWTTNAFLFECPKIFAAWGFEFRSSFVWVKSQIGIGNYWRNSHEILLTAIRGDAKRFNDRTLRSWIECDRGPHSAKPEIVRSYIERASNGPYLEMFARSKLDGWDTWGNQIEDNLLNRHVEAAE